MLYADRFFRDKWGMRKPEDSPARRVREHAASFVEIDAEREHLRVATSPREGEQLRRWQ